MRAIRIRILILMANRWISFKIPSFKNYFFLLYIKCCKASVQACCVVSGMMIGRGEYTLIPIHNKYLSFRRKREWGRIKKYKSPYITFTLLAYICKKKFAPAREKRWLLSVYISYMKNVLLSSRFA